MTFLSGDSVGYLSAHEASKRLSRGELSARTVVETLLERIRSTQDSLNAFATLCADDALQAADAADAAAREGKSLGPLHGIPLAVKDILNVAGVRTAWGSRLMADAIAPADTVAVTRLKQAGAIVLGKTTTTEFAHSMMGSSPLTGLTRNPWHPDRTCGGSSAGSGVALAAGLVPLALATDAGASTRLPAACTNVVGLKPTLGLVPHNQIPEGFANFIHLGLMAREVRDVALMLDVVAGAHSSDPHSLRAPQMSAAQSVEEGGDLRGLRILCKPLMGNKRLHRAVEAQLLAAADAFRDLGAEVEVDESPVENAEPTWRILQQSNWAARFFDRIDEIEAKIDSSFAAGIREGGSYSGLELQRALYKRTELFRKTQSWFDSHDFVLTPVASAPPLRADHPVLDPIEIEGEVVGDMRREWTPYLNAFDLSGHPAVSLPAGFTEDGLPLGVQLAGRWYADAALLRAAALYEAACPWGRQRPSLPSRTKA
ncbi:amidase [Rhodospirillaceae bacterium SYSU D60014]|uniref:amidase n=1 Tax=Virgifigura deserti TaxID=2268457 RepID=UPI0013C436C5